MKKVVVAIVIALLLGSVGTFGFLYIRAEESVQSAQVKVNEVSDMLTRVQASLLGYTKYTDYIATTKKAIEGQSSFIAAKVTRDYVAIETVNQKMLGIPLNAAIQVNYAVEYSIGFDLKSDSYSLSGDKDKGKLLISIKRPQLVATPAVSIGQGKTLASNLLINPSTAIANLQQRLLPMAQTSAVEIVKDPAVIALCEKTFGAFIRDFLSKQPGVVSVPAIEFAYR